MKNKPERIIVILLICLSLVIPTAIALANSAPPPTTIYLRFYTAEKIAPNIKGVQFVGCYERSCTRMVNLIEYGQVLSPGFLATPPVESENWHFDCTQSRCLFRAISQELKPYKYLRVITLHDEIVQSSKVLSAPDCNYCTVSWKVNLGEEVPSITDDEEFESGPNFINFIITYALTIFIEILIAFLLLRFLHNSVNLTVRKVLPSILLVNVLSYPVSWLAIPSFGQFVSPSTHTTGLMVTGIVAFYTVISILVQKNREREKKWISVVLAISVPVCLIAYLIASVLISYGDRTVVANGLPWSLVVLLAEIFAVVFESSVLFVFFKRVISYKKVLLFALIANAASFLLGYFLFLG